LLAALVDRTTTLEEQVSLSVTRSLPRVSIDGPALVAPILPRATTVKEVVKFLVDRTWISVMGEAGAGKTQLCLLTTENTSDNTIWINLPGCRPEMACNVIDQVLESASGFPFHLLLFRWYQEASSRLGAGKVLVLDDLPRVAPGGALSRRLDALATAARINGQRILSASYYALPRQLIESHVVVEILPPRFTSLEISELLRAAGAPSGFPSDKIADFLLALIGGLPVLVAAAARLLKTKNWAVNNDTLESFFRGQFASGERTDARVLSIYDVANVQFLARRLILEKMGFWRFDKKTSTNRK
jgi:hypothetical protein